MLPNRELTAAQPTLTLEFQRLVENVSDVYFIHDLAGQFTYLSPQFERMFGYPVATCLGQSYLPIVHPEDSSKIEQMLQQLLHDRVPHENLEMRVRHAAGHWIWILISHTVVEDATGGMAIQGVAKNISDRKAAEAELALKTTELEQTLATLQRMQTQMLQGEKMSSLGQLVAGIAHEINNPTTFISGNLAHAAQYFQDLMQILAAYQDCYPNPAPPLQMLIEAVDLNYLQTDLPKLLSSMQAGADRIGDIVLSLRNFSRLDEADLKPADLHEGIDSALLILQHRLQPQGQRPQIEVVRSYGDCAPIECYAGSLNQVFMNILLNAIDAVEAAWRLDFCQKPQIVITTQPAMNAIVITIADNGVGIAPDQLTQIFNPFYTTKPVGKGTGMGLAISYQIVVDQHRGELNCISTPEQHTALVMRLPI
jgi:two-component system, NtrC family, sensor kinase